METADWEECKAEEQRYWSWANINLEAERYARMAVKSLDKGDECSLLLEALTTHGVTLARLGRYSNERSQLDRAIEAGENCGISKVQAAQD